LSRELVKVLISLHIFAESFPHQQTEIGRIKSYGLILLLPYISSLRYLLC